MTRPLLPRLWAVALVLAAACGPAARGQDDEPPTLRLDGLVPSGALGFVTEAWCTVRVDVTNLSTEPRDARVVLFFPEQADLHYTRDVFVPARSTVSSWLTVGPAPAQRGAIHRDVEVLLYDRTGGRERRIRPRGEERVQSRPILYRKRDVTVSVLAPDPAFDTIPAGDDPDAPEPVTLARTLREGAGRSEFVAVIGDRLPPPRPEAFEGIEILVVASGRLAADPAVRQAVRRWVQQGGTLWVLLDRVDLAGIAPLLGDGFDVQVVDRVGLTMTRLHRAGDDPAGADARDHDRPVEMVRVVVGAADTVLHTANGWPASFVRNLGRGRVLFTAIGARGWYRPRGPRDPRSRFDNFPDQPVPLSALGDLAARFHPREVPPPLPTDALRDVLAQEVGYTVVGRGTAAAIFGGFVVALLGIGFALRRSRRPELLGWLAPAAAVGAAAAFVGLGEVARQGIPPTLGIAEVVDAVPESGDAAASGVFAVYRPGSGPVPLASELGGVLDLDQSGLDGQSRRRVVTDLEAWHWEGLNLPAGIRTGSFRSTIRAARLSAVARFGPDGLDGRLATGPFRGAADGLIVTPARAPLPVRFGGEAFSVRGEDALPPGQFIGAAVLSDRQQRRQAVYRQMLGGALPKHWESRDLLLAWAEPGDVPFRVEAGDRVVGTALLAVPLAFERPPIGTPVTIPAAFVPYMRMLLGRPSTPALEGNSGVEMELRFQLPQSVLPLTAERVRFTLHIRSPGRRIVVSGHGEAGLVGVFEVDSPLDPVRVEIADPRLLQPDSGGGLRLTLTVGEQRQETPETPTPPVKGPPGKGTAAKATEQTPDVPWKIEAVGLEVVGRTR